MPTARPPLKTLDRVLSKAGLGSRVEACGWIRAGRVTVNGRPIRRPDHWVHLTRDRVALDGRRVTSPRRVYCLLHKPVGYLTTYRDPHGRPTVYDLINDVGVFVAPAGRLDLDTSGLLLLTNDTQLADRITSPAAHVPKTYLVTTSRRLTDEEIARLRAGVRLADGPTRSAVVTRAGRTHADARVELTITEGRNRQVRRMIEAVDATVVALVRTRIGRIRIGTLAVGRWRSLTAAEVESLNV